MSLLDQIKKKRSNLRATETIVTRPDGIKFIESENCVHKKILNEKTYGFIVDNKPDKIPACIIENQLYLGSQDSVDNDNIENYGITHILSIGIDAPPLEHKTIIKKFIPVLDLPDENIKLALDESISFINHAIREGGKILVHCNAGVSRSATVVIAYLIVEKNFSFPDALQFVKSKRECICPNVGFIEQLKNIK